MSNISFSEEPLTTATQSELQPLIEAHKEEVSIFEGEPLSVDWESYYKIQAGGFLKMYMCRVDSALVGYAIYIVNIHPHYSNMLCAIQDVLFLSKKERKGSAGMRLIRYSEQQLKALGVDMVMQHTKQKKDLSRMLSRMGYNTCDIIMTKRLNHGY